jgi:xylan 1,4-beta-xylosidase
MCVGSGHAALALRADYRDYMTRVQKDIGFKYVRFHGLLNDDMSAYTLVNGKPTYSFFNIDSIFDFLRSIQMRPVFRHTMG